MENYFKLWAAVIAYLWRFKAEGSSSWMCLLLKTDPWNHFQAVLNNRGGHTKATAGDAAAFFSILSVWSIICPTAASC
jgi:hypothetical protein